MAKKYASLSTLQTFLSNLRNLFATKSEVDEKSKVQIVETNETGAFIEDLQTLTIHKLTQEQYEEKLTNGDIDANALYLTPQEEIDLTPYATTIELNECLGGKANASHSHAISDINNLQPSLDSKTPTSRTINGKALTSNIVLTSSDVGAANATHNHNDVYYTESEVDTKLAGKSDTTHKHDNSYDAKGSADNALKEAKSYTDTKTSNLTSATTVDNKINAHNTATSAHNDIRELISGLTNRLNTLANSDDTTLDQMSEIVAYIKNNKSLIDGVTTSKVNVSDIVNNLTTSVTNKPLSAAQGVAIKTLIDNLQEEFDGHSHDIADVSGLQSALDGKAAASHGTHVSYSTTAPVMDGTASVGSATTVARSDHKHPTDTSRASKSEFDTHDSNTTKHITSTERTNWNAAKTHADSTHAPSNAEKNQNAFSNIAVSGQTTVAADTATDTVTFAGSNVSITTDATNDKVTFSVANGSTSAKGVVQLTNSTSSTSTTTAATPNSVKSAYDLANTAKTNAATAQTRADSAYTLAESKVDSLSDLGITATATELNYIDGTTSNVQEQLDGKAASGHTHNYAGSSSAGGAATSALTCTGNAATATKLKDGKTISLGTGVTGTATSFDGSSNITIPVTDIKESYLSWGGKSLSGSVSPISAALSSEHSANRLAYLNPNAIKVEYSDNSGSTWTDGKVDDATKVGFVTTSGTMYIGSASTVTTNHRTRVTLTAQDGTNGYVYTRPRKMLLNVSTVGHGISVTIEAKTGASGASWVTLGTYSLTGWSGWNDIPLSISTFGGSKTQTTNYWYMRLTFATTSVSESYPTSKSSIIGMRLFGDTCWTKTSNMGETGHLYSYDSNQNAAFPAAVNAVSFTENGTALSSKYSAKNHAHVVSDITDFAVSDWSQNNSSSVDYIKNRTHWAIEGTKTVVTQTTQFSIRKAKTGTSNATPEYDYNKEYIVTVDGTKYRCSPYVLDDGYGTACFTLGDSRLRETMDSSHPENVPFLVQAYIEDDGGSGATMYHCWQFDYSTAGTHTIEIAELTGENEYHPLNDGFIPNTIQRKIAGIVHQYAGASAPNGYLLCDGSFYRTDEYPELFDAIGFTYGESGSGVNLMFAVPNLATRVPVGVGSGYALGSTGGEATHTLTVSEMPKHDHGAVYTGNADSVNKKYAWYTATGDKIGYQVMESGSGVAHNNMQPYIALNYIISTGK